MTLTQTVNSSLTSSGGNPSDICWEMSLSPSGTSILKLHGRLKPGWLGRLSSYLAINTINLISGTARKSSSLCWEATFEIGSENIKSDPFAAFDPLPAVTAFEAHAGIPVLKISDYVIEYSARHGGCLYVEISGIDCIGFLYGIVRIFSFYSLFPVELEISTRGLVVHDRFWLKGIGSAAPSDDDLRSLHERLKQCN